MQQNQIIDWIKAHAPLRELCENGGWPDASHMQIDVRSQTGRECIVDIEFTESTMEISECDVHQATHGGEFVVRLNDSGEPVDIRLLHALWSEGDVAL